MPAFFTNLLSIVSNLMRSGQKLILSDPCITRGERAVVGWPKRALVCVN